MADHENDTPGEPPAIRDEAADSPMWLPALGLALLLLGAVLIVWRSSGADETQAGGDETVETEPADTEQATAVQADDEQATAVQAAGDEGEAEPADAPNAPE